ncbi:hypothetical protein QEO94_04155 [Kingella negevensis]|uniref:hypothetical protein n=1 Tax=Kingella negevensis TaxID=1522312 RepID=UPI002543C58F|nr:hypothetical protein [Kingella negevensis]WII93993.1 hypothetical protein QEO94_04155 [Kingella negevensis]
MPPFKHSGSLKMQKFILLRGHEGSGKSTFAQEKIAQFQQTYPQAEIHLIDNDIALTNEHGEYHFDFPAFAAAHQQNVQRQQQALQNGKMQPEKHILIINANPNQKTKTCQTQITAAQQHGFETEIYRLHNFYPNIHNVDEASVLQSYLRLNNNSVQGEIHVPATQPPSEQQRQKLAQMQNAA